MAGGLNPEARARVLIDKQLEQAEWVVQDRSQIDLVNHAGVAVRETIMDRGATPKPSPRNRRWARYLCAMNYRPQCR
jgi:hypothetical protein